MQYRHSAIAMERTYCMYAHHANFIMNSCWIIEAAIKLSIGQSNGIEYANHVYGSKTLTPKQVPVQQSCHAIDAHGKQHARIQQINPSLPRDPIGTCPVLNASCGPTQDRAGLDLHSKHVQYYNNLHSKPRSISFLRRRAIQGKQ